MEDGVAEYRFGNAIVRFRPSKLPEEESKALIKEATQDFLKEVLMAKKKAAKAAKKGCS